MQPSNDTNKEEQKCMISGAVEALTMMLETIPPESFTQIRGVENEHSYYIVQVVGFPKSVGLTRPHIGALCKLLDSVTKITLSKALAQLGADVHISPDRDNPFNGNN